MFFLSISLIFDSVHIKKQRKMLMWMINQFLKRIRIQRIINFLRILERMKLLTKATFSPIKKQAKKKQKWRKNSFVFFVWEMVKEIDTLLTDRWSLTHKETKSEQKGRKQSKLRLNTRNNNKCVSTLTNTFLIVTKYLFEESYWYIFETKNSELVYWLKHLHIKCYVQMFQNFWTNYSN